MAAGSYFVYILESGQGVHEGRALSKLLTSLGVPFSYERVADENALEGCLRNDLPYALQHLDSDGKPHRIAPILHISAHGAVHQRIDRRPARTGISLTNGGFVPWRRFREATAALNASCGGDLVLCLSVCHGVQASSIAMGVDSPDPPFRAMVAPCKPVKIGVSESAFLAFYTELLGGASLPEAVDRMRRAVGNSDFSLHDGHQITAAFRRIMARVRDGELGDGLRDMYQPTWSTMD